ncbi:MAG TPA: WYL domain-containing protein [Spirochaetota bacterium]|nr:WYL domain-containing protein [Spirochaetota bacterium]
MNHDILPSADTEIERFYQYLHILALLQNPNEIELKQKAEIYSFLKIDFEQRYPHYDDQHKKTAKFITPKNIENYIKNTILNNEHLNIRSDKKRYVLNTPYRKESLLPFLRSYTAITVTDAGKQDVLLKIIKSHKNRFMWNLATVHFAIIERRILSIDYLKSANADTKTSEIVPHHLVYRNNNLYLIGRVTGKDNDAQFIYTHIKKIKPTDKTTDLPITPLEDIYKDTIGSFFNMGKEPHNVKIRYCSDIKYDMERLLKNIEADITDISNFDSLYDYEARFKLAEDTFFCKQIFGFGNKALIIEPADLKEMMINTAKKITNQYVTAHKSNQRDHK